MLTSEPLVSIEVHNMRDNPNLVPEKMVAFQNKSQQERKKIFGQRESGNRRRTVKKKITQFGQDCDCPSAECEQGKVTPCVLDRAAESWAPVHRAAFVYCVFCVTALQSLISGPLWREHKMLRVKPLSGPRGAMATPTKQQRAQAGQAGSERAGQERKGWEGGSSQASCQS